MTMINELKEHFEDLSQKDENWQKPESDVPIMYEVSCPESEVSAKSESEVPISGHHPPTAHNFYPEVL